LGGVSGQTNLSHAMAEYAEQTETRGDYEMKYQTIYFQDLRLFTKRIVQKDTFSFNEERGFKFIQKICFYILTKLKCHNVLKEDCIKHYTLELSALESILKQENVILEKYDRLPKNIFIGSKEFAELCGDLNSKNYINLSYAEFKTFMGMKIHIVPHMKGILVVP
jgi:hypothetical protein